MTKIGIIGAGKIGLAVKQLLSPYHYELSILDTHPKALADVHINANDEVAMMAYIRHQDIVISCAAFHANRSIAKACAKQGIAYFDLTEDVSVTDYIKQLKSTSILMPQCGLAPGAVNIITADLIKSVSEVYDVKIRVGALPINATNAIGYHLTWSTEGLVNEYCQLVDILTQGQKIKVQPLEGLETIYVDEMPYEAFYTSGGVASMCDEYEGIIPNMSYKTIRYPGHQAHIKFLLEDLNLKQDPTKLVALFNDALPYTKKDVVVILITVKGIVNGRLEEVTYQKKIYGDESFSAIQLATASGVCAVVQAFIEGKITGQGFQSQSSIPFNLFISNSFGALYA